MTISIEEITNEAMNLAVYQFLRGKHSWESFPTILAHAEKMGPEAYAKVVAEAKARAGADK